FSRASSLFFFPTPPPPSPPTLFPYTTLFRSIPASLQQTIRAGLGLFVAVYGIQMTFKTHNPLILLVSLLVGVGIGELLHLDDGIDRKSTRLNSSHVAISYAVFCLKKKRQ